MKKELCCKDCFYFNKFGFCTIRPDMIVKCNRDDPLCFGFRFKDNYPIEELGSLEKMISESIEDCLNKESMIPRKKTLYVLVQKTISKVTDETKTEELLVSDDIMDILNRLMEELKIDHEHYCSVEMTDAKSFISETFDRAYIYSIHFKKDPKVMRFKGEEK